MLSLAVQERSDRVVRGSEYSAVVSRFSEDEAPRRADGRGRIASSISSLRVFLISYFCVSVVLHGS
jgi:hypothetical protein